MVDKIKWKAKSLPEIFILSPAEPLERDTERMMGNRQVVYKKLFRDGFEFEQFEISMLTPVQLLVAGTGA